MILSEGQRREPPKRPSAREILNKIAEAARLLKLPRWSPGLAEKLKPNFDELEEKFGIETTLKEDQQAILLAVLSEIKHDNYVGDRPPQLAYEEPVKGQDMWEFRWNSTFFRNELMYFKFAFSRGNENTRRLFILSIHPNRNL